jgi:DNA-binding Xre family transcriptional regulator
MFNEVEDNMPTYINIEPAVLRWQARHGKRMTNEELAERAGISIAALYRMKSGDMIAPDLRKINEICKVLECEPGEIIVREKTAPFDEGSKLEAERVKLLKELEQKIKRQQDHKQQKNPEEQQQEEARS